MAVPPAQTTMGAQPTTGSTTLLEIKLTSSTVASVAVVLSAAATIGATTLTVTALTGAIPAGTVLHFVNQDVTTTAAAAAAATSLVVLPLSLALLSAATASSDGYTVLPILGDVNLTFSPTDAAYQAYATSGLNVWDYAVKTAMNGKLEWKIGAADNDPAVVPFVQAGLQSGSAAYIYFRLRRASGAYYQGVSTIGVNQTNPARGIAETMFSGTTSGVVTFSP